MVMPLDFIMAPVQAFLLAIAFYYLIVSFFGFYRVKDKTVFPPQKRFAVIVAAHNEERVIASLIENLRMLNYPDSLYDIHVVADNCDDMTAQIARQHNAIVHERRHDREKGKGYALEWMFARLFAAGKHYDAVAVFDADNLVHPMFLQEMNNCLCKGKKVIQGYLDCKNPNDTWVSATFSIGFWVVDHAWHLAKHNLGLSSVLGGTGMCISTDVLREHGWGATCLTEDMEFTMKALLKGVPTYWAHDAIVYDEKPLTFKQSWHQRKRWAQGHFDVAARYVPRLFANGLKQRNIHMFDGIIHLLQPYFLLISTAFFLCNILNDSYPLYTNVFRKYLPLELWVFICLWQYILPLLVLFKVRASLKTFGYFILYPVFIYSWVPITILGFIDRNKREWSHTIHTRNISYQEMAAAEKFGGCQAGVSDICSGKPRSSGSYHIYNEA
ncbi:MAG: glycosyltransferase [Acidaminococcales bacterium]|jgi:cellulose synthase/poly-beta-1,6-N-acetylglucosamine synthase-like glycosyltransferase|nr:glycosyltransferase [Acidaminococcales bacterium]